MWWAAAINVGLSLFGASKQKKAGKQARKIAGLNVEAEKAESAETIRRMTKSAEQQEGYARATAGASGFSIQKGTSQFNYIKEMVAENTRQRTFAAAASLRKQGILAAGGEAAKTSADASALSSIAGAASSLGSMFSQGKASGWGFI